MHAESAMIHSQLQWSNGNDDNGTCLRGIIYRIAEKMSD